MVRKNTANGFTLIELLIALVIVGILAAIALPSYMESVRKGRRSDAVASLQQVQQAQERFRANNMSYASNLSDLSPPLNPTSPERHYNIALSNASAAGYTVTATAADDSPQASDSRCRMLQVVQTGGNVTYNSTSGPACWTR